MVRTIGTYAAPAKRASDEFSIAMHTNAVASSTRVIILTRATFSRLEDLKKKKQKFCLFFF